MESSTKFKKCSKSIHSLFTRWLFGLSYTFRSNVNHTRRSLIMKKILLVFAATLLLAACGTPTATAVPSTPTGAAVTPAFTPEATTIATPAGSTPGAADDAFVQNGITLSAPVCDGTFTPEQTEGPYYKEGSPEQSTLYESGMAGTRLIVVGYVLDANCQPVPGAWLDFWQADGNGEYDNAGYSLRGHQFTDEQGRYFLETVFPGEYPGRTQHIHVKVQPPGGQVITSQLYFPGSAGNTTDGIFTSATLVTVEDMGDHQVAYYNFVLNAE
jgi:protocatechuate 3,4-dioxygenase beta subunit